MESLKIDASEAEWRRNVRNTMRMFLRSRYLPLEARVRAIEQAQQLEGFEGERMRIVLEDMKKQQEKLAQNQQSLTMHQERISAGIDLLKWLVPGVPVCLTALWFFLDKLGKL